MSLLALQREINSLNLLRARYGLNNANILEEINYTMKGLRCDTPPNMPRA